MPILVGSRGSDLARTQVRQYLELLAPLCPGVEFKRRVITEAGDRDRVSLLADVAGRSAGSAFSSRLEAALAAVSMSLVLAVTLASSHCSAPRGPWSHRRITTNQGRRHRVSPDA